MVADRISEPGRDELRQAGWGWLNRRGHLRVWTPGVRIESPTGTGQGASRSRGAEPWTTVGLEVALAALIDPEARVTARRLAPLIGRSVGATHEIIGRFAEVGLVGPDDEAAAPARAVLGDGVARWPDDGWQPLPVDLPELAAKVGPDLLVRVDERAAATLGGARVPAAGDLPARCYVPSTGALRRAVSLADRDAETQCWVRRAPVVWVPENRDHPPSERYPWRVAHPMLCALRLARDPARGAEVVEDWGIVPGGTR